MGQGQEGPTGTGKRAVPLRIEAGDSTVIRDVIEQNSGGGWPRRVLQVRSDFG